jgi:hypothetical protein
MKFRPKLSRLLVVPALMSAAYLMYPTLFVFYLPTIFFLSLVTGLVGIGMSKANSTAETIWLDLAYGVAISIGSLWVMDSLGLGSWATRGAQATVLFTLLVWTSTASAFVRRVAGST